MGGQYTGLLGAVERGEDWAGASARPGAGRGQAGERVAGLLKLGDLLVDRGDAGLSKLSSAGAVVGRVEVDQLLDLIEGETRRLSGADEAQPLEVLGTVAAYLTRRPRRLRPQPAALLIADGFDTHARSFGEPADRVGIFGLIPYHGTEAIWCERNGAQGE